MPRALCEACRAPVRYLTTPTGKAIAVDPLFLSEWVTDNPPSSTTPRRITLLSGDGTRFESGYLAMAITPQAHAIQGYQPHWASCAAQSTVTR